MQNAAVNNEEVEFENFLQKISELGGQKLLTSLHTLPTLRLIFDARSFAAGHPKTKMLNIFASKDNSGFREKIFQPLFEAIDYDTVDFWQDKFIYKDETLPNSYTLPFPDNSFDALLTTKVLLEHVSEPAETVKEISRV